MSTLSCVLHSHLLEKWILLLSPCTFWSKHRIQMAPLLRMALSDKVIDQESTFVLPLELLLTQASNCIKCLLLYAFEDLIFCLFILAYRLNYLHRVCPSSGFELL